VSGKNGTGNNGTFSILGFRVGFGMGGGRFEFGFRGWGKSMCHSYLLF